MTVGIVIPVFNQLAYTRQCLESLRRDASIPIRIAVINNASTDGTSEFLRGREDLLAVHNQENRGCAASWNQGVAALQTTWTVLLNNDVLLPHGFLGRLLDFARERRCDIASPAMREGELNYDFPAYASEFVRRMDRVERRGAASGVCFMVHQRVFERIGPFDENFRIGVFEDADFFLRARLEGFQISTGGRSFLHHFGSVTQNEMGAVHTGYEARNRAYFRKKWGQHWAKRRWLRLRSKTRELWWRTRERLQHGHSLKERWLDGKLRYY